MVQCYEIWILGLILHISPLFHSDRRNFPLQLWLLVKLTAGKKLKHEDWSALLHIVSSCYSHNCFHDSGKEYVSCGDL